MTYNNDFEFAGICFDLIIIIYHFTQYKTQTKLNKMFRTIAVLLILNNILDVVACKMIEYHEHIPMWLNQFANTFYFNVMLALSYMLMRYIVEIIQNSGKKVNLKIASVTHLIFEVILFANVFFGYAIYFDANGYEHGPIYPIVYAFPFLFVFSAGVVAFTNRKVMGFRQAVSAVIYVLLVMSGLVMQTLLNYGVLLSGFGASLALLVILLSLETPDYEKLKKTMTELEVAKQLAEEEKEKASQANQAKSTFLANMSHEIRTPLNAILGMDEMILRESTEKDVIEYGQNIHDAGTNLLAIINDILDFSKIESGKMEIVEDEYSLSSTLNDIVTMIELKASQKGLAFAVNVDETIPENLYGDQTRVRQVAVNILNNAVKYTRQGSVTLHVESKKIPAVNEMSDSSLTQKTSAVSNGAHGKTDAVNIDAQEKSSAVSNGTHGKIMLKISVVDTGIGIKEEDKEKLFSDFQRLDLKENRTIEGTGLGLAITSKLVEQMNGWIEVESEYGKGSTFSIYIPQIVITDEAVGNFKEKYRQYLNSRERYHESFTAPSAHIMVVDDNDMNLKVIKNLLKKTEIQVKCCTSGRAFLQCIKDETFDVILLDHMMPEMDGIETLHAMREDKTHVNQTTPVIMLTANAIRGMREQYLSEGFSDYLSKPIDAMSLEKMILKYLDSSKISYLKNEIPQAGSSGELNTDIITEDAGNGSNIPESDTFADEDNEEDMYDTEQGLTYCGGFQDMYVEMLDVFAEDFEKNKDLLEQLLQDENWKDYSIKVHGIKSNAKTVGAIKLADMAYRLEIAGKDIVSGKDIDKNINLIREKHMAFIEYYKKVIDNKPKI